MNLETVSGLLANTTMLVSLVLVAYMLPLRRGTERLIPKLISGLVVSLIAVLLLLNPWQVTEHVNFSSRTVLLSLSGLFLGPIPTCIGLIASIAVRIGIGGPELLPALLNLSFAAVCGLTWRKLRHRFLTLHVWYEFVGLGFLVHAAALVVLAVTLPAGHRAAVLDAAMLPFLVYLPLVTLVIGLLLSRSVAERSIKDTLIERDHALVDSKAAFEQQAHTLEELIDSMPVMVGISGPDGQLRYVNRCWVETLGWTLEELRLLDNPIAAFYPDADELERVMQHVVAGDGRWDSSYTRTKTGSYIWTNWANVILSDGTRIGIGQSVHERVVAESRMRKLSFAVEASGSAIVITGTDGVIEYVNRKFEELTGYTRDEVVGGKPSVLKSGETPSDEYKTLWETISAGMEWHGVFHNRRKNGELFWEKATIAPVRDEHGHISSYIAIKDDITAERQLIDELIEARQQAERSERLKDAFMAMVSHEIRTPINLITGYLSLLEDDLHIEEVPHDERYFQNIHSGVERLTRTIDLMLAVSRVDSGDVHIMRSKTDLVSVMHDVIAAFTLPAKAKGINIVVETTLDSYDVLVDKYMITEAISNLVDNAVKFTREGSVTVRLRQEENRSYIDVADTGIGISEEFMAALYVPFSQEQKGYTRAYEGIGLGLSLVKRYLELNYISIGVTSSKGVGTTFSLDVTEIRM